MMNVHPEDPTMMMPGETIEEFISRCMSSINYETTRISSKQFGTTSITNFEKQFHHICHQIYGAINQNDHYLSELLYNMLALVRKINEWVIKLKQFELGHSPDGFLDDYMIEIKITLEKLVQDSYEDEKRKLEVAFGLVGTIAELLIADSSVFKFNTNSQTHSDEKIIKKFIANLLTNLVYGNALSKRFLCNYSGFVEQVTFIVKESSYLTSFYAALIRNLSWNADDPMKQKLMQTVPALTLASIRAYNNRDEKCFIATLSALWNLGSHSMENKKAICETKEFLPLLIKLLDCSPANTVMVENASGTLKYAASYFVNKPKLLEFLHSKKLVKQLVMLLNSPSFTVVVNSLNTLGILVAKDYQTQAKLIKDQQAMVWLDGLKNSNKEDIRNPVKQIFSHLYSSSLTGYTYSMPNNARPQGSSTLFYGPRMGTLPAPGSSKMMTMGVGRPYMNQNLMYPENAFQQQHDTMPKSMKRTNIPSIPQFEPQSSAFPQENVFLKDSELYEEAGIGIPDSLIGTRSGSIQSLNDEVNNTSWQSSSNTDAVNSTNMSPVSESELPASPTEFAAQQVLKQSGKIMEDDFYEPLEDEVLSKVIDSVLPKPASSKLSIKSTPHLPKNAKPICLPLNQLEQQMKFPRSPDVESDIDYDDSIIDEDNHPTPPQASASSSVASEEIGSVTTTDGSMTNGSKNVKASTDKFHHLQAVKQVQVQNPSRDLMDAMKTSSLIPNPKRNEKICDASNLCPQKEFMDSDDDDELSDDSYCYTTGETIPLEDLTALPDDVDQAFLAEKMIIDCASLNLHSNLCPQKEFMDSDDDDELSDDSYCYTTGETIPLEDLTALPDDVDQAFLAEKMIIDCASLNLHSPKKSTVSGIPKSSMNFEKIENIKIGKLSAATIKRLSKSRHPLPLIPPKSATKVSNSTKSAKVSPFNYKEPKRAQNCPEKSSTNKLLVSLV
uniref:Uncharacterized protein n=1 Tax=Panagrolaimus sp. JU765 TaxID=591449 RepID=A0AC34QDN2_9BILA